MLWGEGQLGLVDAAGSGGSLARSLPPACVLVYVHDVWVCNVYVETGRGAEGEHWGRTGSGDPALT